MNKQSGMTLVELIITVAITGVIVAFLGTSIFQIFTVSDYGNSRLTATHELQNAAYWFHADGQGALSATGGTQMVMTLSDNTTVTYTTTNTTLLRIAGGKQITLASNINAVSFSVSGRTVTMNLTSTPASQSSVSQNGTYIVYLRPAGGG
jgi:prepilin-type N-terminal cleavage/methylation domain-containing protein